MYDHLLNTYDRGDQFIKACGFNEAHIIRRLLDEGADVEQEPSNPLYRGQISPLLQACRHGRLDTARLLLTRSRSKNFSSSTTRYSSASTPSARPRRARVRTDGSSRRERTRRASRPSCRPHPRAWPWRPFRPSQIGGGLARTLLATVAGGSWSHSTSKREIRVCVILSRPPPRGPRRRPSAGRSD